MAGPLKSSTVRHLERRRPKGNAMWVYDGENWTDEESDVKSPVRPEPRRPHYDEPSPELQVVEIVPVRIRIEQIPWLPFP